MVDPQTRTVDVHTSPEDVVTLPEDQVLDGGVLPGFAMNLRDLFARLDQQQG